MKYRSKLLVMALILVITILNFSFFFVGNVKAVGDPVFTIAAINGYCGDIVETEVVLNNLTTLTGANLYLNYNPDLLEPIEAELIVTGFPMGSCNIDTVNHRIATSFFSSEDVTVNSSGQNICRVKFRLLTVGTGNLSLSNIGAYRADGSTISFANPAITEVAVNIAAAQDALTIGGVSDGENYTAAVTPTIITTDTTINAVSLSRNGVVVPGYISGQTVTQDGAYVLIVQGVKSGQTINKEINFSINAGMAVTSQEGMVGDTVQTVVNTRNISRVAGGQVDISYDPTKVEPIIAEYCGNSAFMGDVSIDKTNHKVTVIFSSANDVTVNPAGEDFGRISWRLLNQGTAPLTLGNGVVYAADGKRWDNLTLINGAVTAISTDQYPVINISGVSNNSNYITSVTPTISVENGNITGVNLKLNGTEVIGYQSGQLINAPGAYMLTVQANKSGGRAATKTVSFSIGAYLSVGSISVKIGNPVNFQVKLSNIDRMIGAQFDLLYDPNKVEPVLVTTDIISAKGFQTDAHIIPEQNLIRVVIAAPAPINLDSEQMLCQVQLNIKKLGTSAILITNDSVLTDTGTPANYEISNGQVDAYIDECFIATACFGSKYEKHVVLLRQFRDHFLLTSRWGRHFVNFYYKNSPPIAHYIAANEPLKLLTRGLLTPLIVLAFLLFHPIYILPLMAGVLVLLTAMRKHRRSALAKD